MRGQRKPTLIPLSDHGVFYKVKQIFHLPLRAHGYPTVVSRFESYRGSFTKPLMQGLLSFLAIASRQFRDIIGIVLGKQHLRRQPRCYPQHTDFHLSPRRLVMASLRKRPSGYYYLEYRTVAVITIVL